MTTENWDPLELQDSATIEIVAAAKKREIRNILKSYVGFYDPFCELIQNALDAVDQRRRNDPNAEFDKQLWIKIDLKENSLSVTDNGLGFTEEQFRMFLSPSISFKNTGDTRGNKGVGATYLGYGFNYLEMATKTIDHTLAALIQDGKKWVDDEQASVGRPIVKVASASHTAFNAIDHGSTFTLKFSGNVRPSDLSWIGASNADQWRVLLLLKTPLGQVLKENQDESIKFHLEVVSKDGIRTELNDQECLYIFPHTVIRATAKVSDIHAEQARLISSGRDASKLPAKFKRLNAVYEVWDTEELVEFAQSDEEKEHARSHQVWAYGFFCYSAPKVLDRYNDETAELRKGQRVIRGGLQLATNHMPQGELITIPLTSNIGYQNQSHIVVHLSNADPDLGRKGFQPELQKLAERLAVSIVGRLKQWRHLLLTDKGPGGSHQEELALDKWITQQRTHESDKPLILSNPNFFVPVNEISMTAVPNSEQDVVALFNQLVAGGVIRGIRLMASSSHHQYDGLYRFHLRAPLANHEYDKGDNPLGIQDSKLPEDFTSIPYVLEFKYSLDALIADFENEEKSASSINLAISWEMGTRYKERYQAVPLLLPDNLHLREFHGLTHLFYDDNTGEKRMDVIVLSDLLRYLDDPQAEETRQEELFGEP